LAAILPHPSMAKWPILNKLSGFACFNQLIEEASSIFYSSMDEHERTLDPENCRDFLDLMLVEHQNASGPESPFYGTLGRYTILNSMMDLFFAGMDTTSSSLVNLFLQMLHHPEVQPQVQEEIDRVVGRKRFPSFQDQVPSP
jgi:cytochrome P450